MAVKLFTHNEAIDLPIKHGFVCCRRYYYQFEVGYPGLISAARADASAEVQVITIAP